MKYFGALSLSLLFIPSLVCAQLTPEATLQQLSQNVDITVSPQNPGPNTNVYISIQSYSTDLDRANITWSVGGKVLTQGIGQKSFTLKTGGIGSVTTVTLDIKPSDGDAFEKTITLSPSSVDLFWQADSYTPPFYEGKAQFAKQNSITFVAIPNIIDANGNAVNIKNVVYTWSKDGAVLGSLSGTGQNTLTLADTLLGLPMSVSVSVSTLDNTFTATNSLVLQAGSPLILFYENNPLYGVLFNRELGDTFSLSTAEVSVIGIPYYFSNSAVVQSTLKYTWSLNGSTVQSPNQNSITLRQQSNSTGSSALGLKIENPNTLLQTAQTNSTIQFGNQTSF